MTDALTNEDGNTVADMRPSFSTPTLDAYLDEAELLELFDAQSEEDIHRLEHDATQLEDLLTQMHLLTSAPLYRSLLGSISDNARDLAFDDSGD